MNNEHENEERALYPSAITDEGREQELIALSYDLVEKRLREGTATSQETTHFLKLGSSIAKLERERMAAQVELSKAKVENLKQAEKLEALYKDAMEAFGTYRSSSTE